MNLGRMSTGIWSIIARAGPKRDLNPDHLSTAQALKHTQQRGNGWGPGLQMRPSQRQGERRVGSDSSRLI